MTIPEQAVEDRIDEILRIASQDMTAAFGDGGEQYRREALAAILATVGNAAACYERRRTAGQEWQDISSEPADNSEIWISNGKTVWLGTAHKDGSLKLPSRSECKFWMPANKPTPPVAEPKPEAK